MSTSSSPFPWSEQVEDPRFDVPVSIIPLGTENDGAATATPEGRAAAQAEAARVAAENSDLELSLTDATFPVTYRAEKANAMGMFLEMVTIISSFSFGVDPAGDEQFFVAYGATAQWDEDGEKFLEHYAGRVHVGRVMEDALNIAIDTMLSPESKAVIVTERLNFTAEQAAMDAYRHGIIRVAAWKVAAGQQSLDASLDEVIETLPELPVIEAEYRLKAMVRGEQGQSVRYAR